MLLKQVASSSPPTRPAAHAAPLLLGCPGALRPGPALHALDAVLVRPGCRCPASLGLPTLPACAVHAHGHPALQRCDCCCCLSRSACMQGGHGDGLWGAVRQVGHGQGAQEGSKGGMSWGACIRGGVCTSRDSFADCVRDDACHLLSMFACTPSACSRCVGVSGLQPDEQNMKYLVKHKAQLLPSWQARRSRMLSRRLGSPWPTLAAGLQQQQGGGAVQTGLAKQCALGMRS